MYVPQYSGVTDALPYHMTDFGNNSKNTVLRVDTVYIYLLKDGCALNKIKIIYRKKEIIG